MKTLSKFMVASLLAANWAYAGNFTEKNAEKTQKLISAAIEAHGGAALTDSLQTLEVSHKTIGYAVDQSRGTEAPWDKNESSGVDAIDLEKQMFYTRSKNRGGGFVGENATLIDGDQSRQMNYRAGTTQVIGEPDYATTSGPFVRVTPALLLRTLNERRANAHYLGKTTVDDEEYKIIAFSMTVGPALSLYFDKENVLRRSERVIPNVGLVEYRFDDYTSLDGILFNQKFTLLLNGDVNLERDLSAIRVNSPLQRLVQQDVKLEEIPVAQPDALSRQELDEGVWLIGGNGTYALFVDMGDYVFAAGGTGGSDDRIDLLQEVVGDKPIKYAMMTHHHFDHVMAIPSYEQHGATIVAAAAHESVVRRAAESGDKLKVKAVKDRMTLGKGSRKVEIIDIGPTAHTEHLLVAYLPEQKILFEADHFSMPRVGPIPPAVPSTQSFAKALASAEIDVKLLLSAHSPKVASIEDLRTALKTEPLQAKR